MWQLTMLFSWMPDWFWLALLGAGILAMVAAWFLGKLPIISTYRFGIQLGGIIATVVAIWFLGAASNEEKHKQALEAAKQEVERIKKESEENAAKHDEELKRKANEIDGLRGVNAKQASALADALKKGGSVQTIKETIEVNMTEAERKKLREMSDEQKKKYEDDIAKLKEAYDKCPTIPAFTVNKIENAIRPPRKKEETK